jgi:hypothetical protein
MNPDTQLTIALVVIWSVALAATYGACVHDPLSKFLRKLRSVNRRGHRKALYLSINHSVRRMK